MQKTQSETIERLTNLLRASISQDRNARKTFLDISTSVLAPSLAVGALLIYAGVALIYDQFYTALGVSPGDVGLSYSNILAGSVGLVVYGLISAFVGVILAVIISYPILKITGNTNVLSRLFKTLWLYPILAAVLILSLMVGGNMTAIKSADALQQGHAVIPSRIGPLVSGIGAGAKPVVITAIGKGADAPNVSSLSSSRLFYLGQANGTVVLYDSANRQAIYLPSSAIRMNVINCLARNPKRPMCDNVYGGDI